MLKEFITKGQQIPHTLDIPPGEVGPRTQKVFEEIVEFLADPERFPNREVNALMKLFYDVYSYGDVLVGRDLTGEVTTPRAYFKTHLRQSMMHAMCRNPW